jgi:hypothetical protein
VVVIATRILISALILTASMAVTAPAMAQGVTARAYSAGELNLVYSLTYQSSQAQAALARQYSARLNQQKRLIDSKDAALGAARRAAQQSKASVYALEREIGTLKAGFIAELAAKDADFARERDNLDAAANDLLKTAEGKRALEIYLAGGPGSAEAAIEILQRVTAKRNAADKRATAALGLDARDKGRLTSAFVLKLYEDVVVADPGNHWNWVELTRLYRDTNQLELAGKSAKRAIETATDDREIASGLVEYGDFLIFSGDVDKAKQIYIESLYITRKLSMVNINSNQADADMAIAESRVGNILFSEGNFNGALPYYDRARIISQKLLLRSPESFWLKGDLSKSLIKIGDIFFKNEKFDIALSQYSNALKLALELQKNDFISLDYSRGVAACHNKVGDAYFAQENLLRAEFFYTESFKISERLANMDKTSAENQRNLSISLEKLASVFLTKGDTQSVQSAKNYFERALLISQNLALENPSSAEAQRDVLVGLFRLAKMKTSKYTWAIVVAQFEAMQRNGQLSSADLPGLEQARRNAAAQDASATPK